MDVNEAILEVIALTRDEVRRNAITLETSLAPDVPLIEGDRVQLQQVVLNLLVNAIEAMRGGGARPRELAIGSARDGANTVTVEVRDSGPGIDPEHWIGSSRRSTRPRRRASGWGCRSAARSSRPMAGGCG